MPCRSLGPGGALDEPPIYLDHHATTPTDPRVVEAMLPYFNIRFGNASSIGHRYGWEASDAVEAARGRVAGLIGAEASEIVFTSGATESNNLALKGVASANRRRGDHLVCSAVEHRAVLDPLRRLAREGGFTLSIVPPDPYGRVDADAIAGALTARTILVSVILANNEIGTINPIAAIGARCRERGITFHSDATQAIGKFPIDVGALGVDLLSLSAHKFHGPKGIGVLYVGRAGRSTRLAPLFDGGGHEHGLRSGTLPVPLIVGLGRAAEFAALDLGTGADRMRTLRDRLHRGIIDRLGGAGVRLNGHPIERLPNNLHLSFEGIDGVALMRSLDGLAVSAGAACSAAEPTPSHVLQAIGLDEALAGASLRFGLGRGTTAEEVDTAASIVARAVQRLRGSTLGPTRADL